MVASSMTIRFGREPFAEASWVPRKESVSKTSAIARLFRKSGKDMKASLEE
jgi:hypothetical protein